jgi:UDP-N-acetyl-2-amino-2-deoxyglucuronate dehydrogenase
MGAAKEKRRVMSERVRVALIGCGRISGRHIDVIRQIPALELVGVCDLKRERAEAAASVSGATAFVDYRGMLEELRPDLVSVLTESGSHADIGCAAAAFARHIVVEKPMALTLDSADSLIETCDRAGVGLYVVKQNRYNPPVARLKQALEEGRFGKHVLGAVRVRWCRTQEYYDQDAWRGTWAMDGGVFANQASHHIDLLQWMMGPVESVKAFIATRLVDIETEDTGVAILRFASGALGIVEATTATRPKDLEGSLSILGETGSVVISGFAVNKVEAWNFTTPAPADEEARQGSVNPPNVYGFGHAAFYRDVVDCIVSNRHPMLDGLEGRKSLELITAIYEAAFTGNEVRLRYVPHNVPLGGKAL